MRHAWLLRRFVPIGLCVRERRGRKKVEQTGHIAPGVRDEVGERGEQDEGSLGIDVAIGSVRNLRSLLPRRELWIARAVDEASRCLGVGSLLSVASAAEAVVVASEVTGFDAAENAPIGGDAAAIAFVAGLGVDKQEDPTSFPSGSASVWDILPSA